MRIVIVNTAASSGGALSILKDFYHYIKENDAENEWIFLLSDKYIEETSNIKVVVKKEIKESWIKRLRWETNESIKFINNLNPDVAFSMQNMINKRVKAKKIVYLHQPVPFQTIKRFSFFKKEEIVLAVYQHIIGKIIKTSITSAEKIIVQTEWMKNAVTKDDSINEENILLIPPTVNNIERIINESYPEENLFFYPASDVIYKNHKILIQAIELLISAGINNFKVILTLEESIKKKIGVTEKIEKNIEFIGSISREEVLEYYRKSILVFPSYIETFGLPLLEAKMTGSIILSANTEFAKEILGKYSNGYFFEYKDSNKLKELMYDIICKKNVYHYFKNTEEKNNNYNAWEEVVKEIIRLGDEYNER